MKMDEALAIIEGRPKGFMVSFEKVRGSMLESDHFPDFHAGEALIPTEEEAWELAQKFADKTRYQCVNIYVITQDFRPVKEYQDRVIRNR